MKTVLKNTIAIAMPSILSALTPSAVKNPDGGWLKNYHPIISNNPDGGCFKKNNPFTINTPKGGWLKNLTKIFATIITATIILTSCKTANVIYQPPIITETFTAPKPIFKDIAFTGKVTDRDGVPMQNVQVFFDNNATLLTDQNGAFEIKANKDIAKNYFIRLEKEGYNNVAQTYHYQMGNTNFNLQMGKPCICPIIEKICNCVQPLNFVYNKNMYANNETELLNIVECLKQNPGCGITINYQYASDKQSADAKVMSVRNFFVLRGINENRITTTKEPNTLTNENTITISN